MFDTLASEIPLFEPTSETGVAFDLRYLPVGPELAAVLATVDVFDLSGQDRLAWLEAHQRMAAHHDAMRLRGMVGVLDAIEDIEEAGSYDPDLPVDYEMMHRAASAEIGSALHLTRRAADWDLGLAEDLHGVFAPVFDLYSAGRLGRRQMLALVNALNGCNEDTAKTAIGQIIDEAPQLTSGQIHARIRKLIISVDPGAAKERYEAAIEDRRVVSSDMLPITGAVSLMGLDLPADRVAAARDHINRLAESLRRPGEDRTIDQLRADVFLDLLTGRSSGVGVQATLHLSIDAETLLRLNDAPADLAGYGPVIADIARQYETHRTTRLEYDVRDPNTGRLILTGVTRKRPQAHQSRWVRARYRRCAFPGCRMPAFDSDLDHISDRAGGGPTTTHNLAPMCRHHHTLKHRSLWNYRRNDDGTHTWTSPLRRTYVTGTDPP